MLTHVKKTPTGKVYLKLSFTIFLKKVIVFRSTLVLCPPVEAEETTKSQESVENCDVCKQQVNLKPKKTKASNSKANSPSSPTTRPGLTVTHLLSDTMYTNVANLQQTMLLQQQLFRQALGQQNNDIACKPTTSFTAPSLSQYQFVSNQQVGIKYFNIW